MKHIKTILVILVLIAIFFVTMFIPGGGSTYLDPRWDDRGRGLPVSMGNDYQENAEMVSDGEGGFIVLWEDSRSGYTSLYGQRIDHDGNILWEKNGKALMDGEWSIIYLVVAPDGSGGIIAAWSDNRGANYDIYAQRYNGDGEELWTADGVPVCTADGDKYTPAIAGDGSGGAFIAWEDQRGTTSWDIFAQHIDENGNPSWTADGVPVCNVAEYQGSPSMDHDGSGGAFVSWNDARGPNYRIYCQHIGSDGEFSWTDGGIVALDAGSDQHYPKTASDGSGGMMVFWKEGISEYNIMGQALDPAGEPRWGTDGGSICTLTGTDGELSISSDGEGTALLVWEHDNKYDYDILAQKVKYDGTFYWGENGTSVCNTSLGQYEPRGILTGDGGSIVVWDDSGPDGNDIRAQRMSPEGEKMWGEKGYPISTALMDQHYPRLASDGQGGAFFVWVDEWSDGADLFAAHVGMVITSEPLSTTIVEDENLLHVLTSNDVSNETWSMETNADWLTLDSNTLSGRPDNSDVGAYWVEMTLEDASGAWDLEYYNIEVVNSPPVITTVPPDTVQQGDNYSFDMDCDDEGLGILEWTLETNADWLFINSTSGKMSGTPENDDVGLSWARVRASDGHGGSSELFFTIEVQNKNDPPVILTPSLPNATEDRTFVQKLEYNDPDKTKCLWKLETNLTWLYLNSTNGILMGTPENDDVGVHLINISITDGENASSYRLYTLIVKNTDDPPVIETLEVDDALQGAPYNFTLEGYDIDPLPHNDTWSVEPAGWLTIDGNTGKLSGTPGPGDVGTFTFTATITDISGSTASRTYTILVENVNDPPVFSDDIDANKGVKGGEMFYLDLNEFISDPDDEEMTWSIDTDAKWLVLEQGVLYGVAKEGQYEVTITAVDEGGGSDSTTFTIDVAQGQKDKEDDGQLGWISLAAALVISTILILLAIIMFMGRRPVQGGGEE